MNIIDADAALDATMFTPPPHMSSVAGTAHAS